MTRIILLVDRLAQTRSVLESERVDQQHQCSPFAYDGTKKAAIVEESYMYTTRANGEVDITPLVIRRGAQHKDDTTGNAVHE